MAERYIRTRGAKKKKKKFTRALASASGVPLGSPFGLIHSRQVQSGSTAKQEATGTREGEERENNHNIYLCTK